MTFIDGSSSPSHSARRSGRRRTRVAALVLTGSACVAALPVGSIIAAPAAGAATLPTIPDSLFPTVAENPAVTVTFEDGTPVTNDTVVHRGDVLLVHGTGFSADANRGGFVLPLAPGVPNGVYVLYSGFGDSWRPSQGASGEQRTHPHDQLAWVLPNRSLDSLAQSPLDMRTPIARESQPMDDDGTFTARITVNPPATTPGGNFGVYVYPAAGSINAAEEIYVPVQYSTEPGPRTPAAPQADLVLDASVIEKIATAAGGKLTPRNGAQVLGGGKIAFTRQAGDNPGVARFQGTVHATAKFSIADVVIQDPWVETRDDGSRVLTALVSDSYNSADDATTRRELGTLVDRSGVTELVYGPVTLGEASVAP